jgi:hypothetical protein
MALLPMRSYLFLLTSNRKILENADTAVYTRLGLHKDEMDFMAEEKKHQQFALASLVTCAAWDHLKATFVKALSQVLVMRPQLCDTSPESLRVRDALKELDGGRSIDRMLSLESAIDRLPVGCREGLDVFEFWLCRHGVEQMNEKEGDTMKPMRVDFVDMHRARNSIVHWMGQMKPKHRPEAVPPDPNVPVFYFHMVRGGLAERYVINVSKYVGVICNRVARTVGQDEPASFA